MFPDGRDHSIVQRGRNEALACRDVLTPVPARPSLFARVMAWVEAVLGGVRAAFAKNRPRRRPSPGSIAESIR